VLRGVQPRELLAGRALETRPALGAFAVAAEVPRAPSAHARRGIAAASSPSPRVPAPAPLFHQEQLRPRLTTSPSATNISLTFPAIADFSSFSIFIASTTITPWSTFTSSPSDTGGLTTCRHGEVTIALAAAPFRRRIMGAAPARS